MGRQPIFPQRESGIDPTTANRAGGASRRVAHRGDGSARGGPSRHPIVSPRVVTARGSSRRPSRSSQVAKIARREYRQHHRADQRHCQHLARRSAAAAQPHRDRISGDRSCALRAGRFRGQPCVNYLIWIRSSGPRTSTHSVTPNASDNDCTTLDLLRTVLSDTIMLMPVTPLSHVRSSSLLRSSVVPGIL